MDLKALKSYFKQHKKLALLILVPLLASIVPLSLQNKPANCAFVLIVMSLYWTTECLPIAITSLIPIVLFPMFGIMSSKDVTKIYFQDIILLFYGGLVMANAIEISGLHERVSLKVLLLFGSNPTWLMLGFMAITAFMSLWISNAASCSMMLPIINAVVIQLIINDELYHQQTVIGDQDNIAMNVSSVQLKNSFDNQEIAEEAESHEKIIKRSEKARNLSTGFMLSCSYSSTIGGLGSLVGTAPNILLKGFIDEKYSDISLSFFSFSVVSLPVTIILILTSWIWLSFKWLPREHFFARKRQSHTRIDHISLVIKEKYENLGPATFQQKCVGVIFVILVILWLTRDLQGLYGWGLLFQPKYVSDATPAVLAVFFLFACPKNNIFQGEDYVHLMNWKQLQAIFPWNVILLIGGGLAIAEGFQNSGLSHVIGENIKVLMSPKKEITLLIIICICAFATEFTSNTSMSSIFIPIVDSIAVELKISPIYLLLPLILSVSLAFMLPVATPNNAIIFASGTVRIRDMITTGIVMNILGLSIVYLAANTWLKLVFDVNFVPESIETSSIVNSSFV